MALFLGIDGIRGGWVGVYADENRALGFKKSERFEQLLNDSVTLAMIDVPIGLPKLGYRQCDIEAKKLVGSRVFLGARQNVWSFDNYERANEYYKTIGQPGISRQLWGIREKLREADEFVTPERQERVKETHPELTFWRLNGRRIAEPKKSSGGRHQRIALLGRYGFAPLEGWIATLGGTGIKPDDLLDACAAAIAARDSRERVPNEGERDDRGRLMEMWY